MYLPITHLPCSFYKHSLSICYDLENAQGCKAGTTMSLLSFWQTLLIAQCGGCCESPAPISSLYLFCSHCLPSNCQHLHFFSWEIFLAAGALFPAGTEGRSAREFACSGNSSQPVTSRSWCVSTPAPWALVWENSKICVSRELQEPFCGMHCIPYGGRWIDDTPGITCLVFLVSHLHSSQINH